MTSTKKFGITYSLDGRSLNTPAEINQARYEIEELIAGKKEEQYAVNQVAQWEEIAAYMDLIASRKSHAKYGESEISVPKAEAPVLSEGSK